MRRYLLSDLALDDLAEIRHFIATQNATAADRVIAGFFRRFLLLSQQPELGAHWPADSTGEIRIHAVGNYLVAYRISGEAIEIARILHGARDLDSLLG